jgi:ABC-type branched-subunit amino acid transport system substrate-binding protein
MEKMKTKNLMLVLLLTALLAACAPITPTPLSSLPQLLPRIELTETSPEKTIIIGFTTSLTGSLSQEARQQNQGLLLWMDDVNNRGGLAISENQIVKFEPRFYDDQSDPAQAAVLYERLIFEDNATFLFGPYSSTLTDAVAPIINQNQKIMISAGAAADATFKKGYQGIYQIYTPGSQYFIDALNLLAEKDSTARKIAIVYENDRFATSTVDPLKTYAESLGYEIVIFESYNRGTTDFSAIIDRLKEAKPDAIFGGGHSNDGQIFAQQIYDNSLQIKFMALLVAPADPMFANLGQAALGIIAPSQWEPRVQFQVDFGPDILTFNQAYQTAYAEEPTYQSAGGYVAGLILEKALLEAGSLNPQDVRAALDEINMQTLFGPIRFEVSESMRGMQIGHQIVYIQWQAREDGTLTKQIIWPEAGKTSEFVYPMR